MPHDNQEDHEVGEPQGGSSVPPGSTPTMPGLSGRTENAFVPLAEPVFDPAELPSEFNPDPGGNPPLPPLPNWPLPQPEPTFPWPLPQPQPSPNFRLCNINLREGCYRISF